MNRVLAGALLLSVAGTAMASTELNLGVSSEYVFRGIPQSDGAQVWASLDYSLANTGFYLGMWVSNAGLAGNEEVDVYGGYAFRLAETIAIDLGAIGYFDPSAAETEDANNSSEVYAGLNWGRLNSYLYYGFGSTLQNDDEYAYIEANYEIDVLADARVRLHAGYFLGMGDFYDLFVDEDYIDYGVSFIKDYGLAGQVVLAVTATSIDAGHGFNAIDPALESSRPQFTVGWSRSFGTAF